MKSYLFLLVLLLILILIPKKIEPFNKWRLETPNERVPKWISEYPDCGGCRKCIRCKGFSKAWERYGRVLAGVNAYIENGTYPKEPIISGEHCEHSKNIENILREYSESLKNELQSTLKGEKPFSTRIPRSDYNIKCDKKCIEVYEEWNIYCITLREIIKYLKSRKSN